MSRTAYIVELFPHELAALGFVAGLLAAQGAEQGELLGEILSRVQIIEVEGDFPQEQLPIEGDVRFQGDTDEMGVVPDSGPESLPEEVPKEVLNLPTPEELGIEINQPPPPPPPPPINRSTDFGAGPPP